MSDEEDAIKHRMMQEQLQNQAQQQQVDAALKVITSQILDGEARERLTNLKVARPDLARQLEMYLAQLHQSGQLRTKITDEQLVMILRKLAERRETTIKRK